MEDILNGRRPRRATATADGAGDAAALDKVLSAASDTVRRVNAGAADTLGDDAPLPADRKALIAAQEALVRPVLALFGIAYDALISMDGKSAYSQAVAARPDLLQAMLASDQPVLAALAVAVGYQPYAAFADKYGKTPEDIKARIRDEVKQELLAAKAQPATPAASDDTVVPRFSDVTGDPVRPRRRSSTLQDVFGR